LRRNVYDEKGKEVKPAEESEKAATGEETSGHGSTDPATKAMDAVARDPKKVFNCFACGVDCTRSRFHYAKSDPVAANSAPTEIKYDLCPNCYFQSRMPNNHRSSDFVKMEEPAYSHIPDKDAPWTDSETLLLLEALETFDENWDAVSKHVGTRTREECVLKFLQLDIQDQYLDDGPLKGAATMRALSGRSPVSQLENPVMSVMSFLAQMADPSVVAAASGRSIDAMQKQLSAALEKGMGGSAQQPAPAPENVKAEDQMEVDETVADGGAVVVNDIATTALATGAARASGFYSNEEREVVRTIGAAVNLVLQKLEGKMAQFNEMEDTVQSERRDLEKARQQLFLDRLSFKKRMKDMESTFRQASLKAPEEGMRMMQEAVSSSSGLRFAFSADDDDDDDTPAGSNTGTATAKAADAGEAKPMEL
jgi:SWI/SNF related-matrix-associated actin-dependent regulator of chromatin subfamily C